MWVPANQSDKLTLEMEEDKLSSSDVTGNALEYIKELTSEQEELDRIFETEKYLRDFEKNNPIYFELMSAAKLKRWEIFKPNWEFLNKIPSSLLRKYKLCTHLFDGISAHRAGVSYYVH